MFAKGLTDGWMRIAKKWKSLGNVVTNHRSCEELPRELTQAFGKFGISLFSSMNRRIISRVYKEIVLWYLRVRMDVFTVIALSSASNKLSWNLPFSLSSFQEFLVSSTPLLPHTRITSIADLSGEIVTSRSRLQRGKSSACLEVIRGFCNFLQPRSPEEQVAMLYRPENNWRSSIHGISWIPDNMLRSLNSILLVCKHHSFR